MALSIEKSIFIGSVGNSSVIHHPCFHSIFALDFALVLILSTSRCYVTDHIRNSMIIWVYGDMFISSKLLASTYHPISTFIFTFDNIEQWKSIESPVNISILSESRSLSVSQGSLSSIFIVFQSHILYKKWDKRRHPWIGSKFHLIAGTRWIEHVLDFQNDFFSSPQYFKIIEEYFWTKLIS